VSELEWRFYIDDMIGFAKAGKGYPLPCHSRHLLSGIQVVFVSDGSLLPTGGDDQTTDRMLVPANKKGSEPI